MSDQPRVEIYTKMDCPYCEKAKDLFDSKDIEYDTYNVTGDDELFEEMVERTDGRKTAPEVFIDDELIGGWDDTSALNENGELDEKLGIADEADSDIVEHRTMIIAGTGIAGLTAAIYAGRSNNEPLVIEGDEPGGQLTLTTDVANYPGFPDGIGGPELVNNMKEQATQFGAELKTASSKRSTTRVAPSGSNSRTAMSTPPTPSSPLRVPAPARSASPAKTN